jgi:hypothetical protein
MMIAYNFLFAMYESINVQLSGFVMSRATNSNQVGKFSIKTGSNASLTPTNSE